MITLYSTKITAKVSVHSIIAKVDPKGNEWECSDNHTGGNKLPVLSKLATTVLEGKIKSKHTCNVAYKPLFTGKP